MLAGGFGLLLSSWLIWSTTASTTATTTPCASITDFKLGYLKFAGGTGLADVDDAFALIGMMMADIEFRKHHDPFIQQFVNHSDPMGGPLGLPHMPIPDLNPCFTITPVAVKRGPASSQSYEINAAWAANSLAHGTNGYPKVHGMFTISNGDADSTVSTIAAAQHVPVMVQVSLAQLSDKSKYPYTFRQQKPDSYNGDLALWYFQQFAFRTAIVFYSTSSTFTAIHQRLLEKAADAGVTDRIFGFPSPVYSEPKPNLALDLVRRAKKAPARLVMMFESGQQNVLYDAMKAEGMWMPRYQILSSFEHVRSIIQTSPLGIFEMSRTPIHFMLPVPDFTNQQTADHLGLWERIRGLKLNGMDLLARDAPRYMLDHQIPEQQWDISKIPNSVYNTNASQLLQEEIWYIMTSVNNFFTYVHAISDLLNAKTPPADIHGAKLRDAMAQVQFPGFMNNLVFYDQSYDSSLGWGIYQTCSGPGCMGIDLFNGIAMAPIAAGTGMYIQLTGIPVLWGNGETNTALAPLSFTQCQAGQKVTATGYSCEACREGFVSMSQNPTTCVACEPGKFAAANATMCLDCAPGKGSTDEASLECSSCQPGTFSRGGEVCSACDKGKFSSMLQASSCQACDDTFSGMTTEYPGALTADMCACPEGSYDPRPFPPPLGGGVKCKPCPEGMQCPFGTAPLAAAGFMLLETVPLSPYKCTIEEDCPGGPPGTCKGGRVEIGCSKCPDGWIVEGDKCVECGPGITAPLYLFYVAVVILLIVKYYALSSNRTRNATLLLSTACTLGMVIGAVQVVGVFDKIPFPWPPVYKDILKVCSLLMLDLEILNVDCAISTSAGKYFNQVVFFFWVLLLLPAFGALSQLLPQAWKWTKARTINIVGAFASMVFVTMINVCQIPINCYAHPNDVGRSVRAYPDVICGDGGSHNTMLVFCCVLFLLAGVFYAACVYAAVSAPKWSADKAIGNDFLVSTRFLFFRFRVDAWYWGVFLLLRSVLIALTPTLFPDEPHAQLIVFCGIFTFFIAMHMRLWPWKVPILNVVEVVIMSMLLLTVATASSNQGFNDPLLVTYITVAYLGAQFVIVMAGISLVRSSSTPNLFYLGKPPSVQELRKHLCSVSETVTEKEESELDSLLADLPIYDLEHIAQAVEVMRQCGLTQEAKRTRGASRRISFCHQATGSKRMSTFLAPQSTNEESPVTNEKAPVTNEEAPITEKKNMDSQETEV